MGVGVDGDEEALLGQLLHQLVEATVLPVIERQSIVCEYLRIMRKLPIFRKEATYYIYYVMDPYNCHNRCYVFNFNFVRTNNGSCFLFTNK